MSKKVLLDPSTGLEDRNARPEVVAAKLHEMAEHCGENALAIGPTERGVLWNKLARVLIPAIGCSPHSLPLSRCRLHGSSPTRWSASCAGYGQALSPRLNEALGQP